MDPGKKTAHMLPEFIFPLFWEYVPQRLDVISHADVIIRRVMERGQWAAMVWLRQTYSKDRLASFLVTNGGQSLPPRELNYWAFITGISDAKRSKWINDIKERPDVWRNRISH